MKIILILLSCFFANTAFTQIIQGRVTDENGKGLAFATILVKGTPLGTITNSKGDYSLTLTAGNYTIEARFVNYASQEKSIVLTDGIVKQDFKLTIQNLLLKEVAIQKGSEDPAYEIIRQAIRRKAFYKNQVKAFTSEVYMKGMIGLLHFPDRILGKKISTEDKTESGIDSSGKGIIYLSESIADIAAQQPNKFKLSIRSNRVSGSNGFGFDFPVFISFYENNVSVFAGQLNPRGFVSPIADGALNYYQYEYKGSFYENGIQVNVIKVIPKRKFEPLFEGIINITENDWRIYSCNLILTKESGLEVLDTLQINQIHVPISDEVWRIKNQVLHVSIDQMGFKAEGNFVNAYSNYNVNPVFKKGFFDRVIIAYDSTVNKRSKEYWDSIRPVPLEANEINDFRAKDSALKVRENDPSHPLKKQGFPTITELFWSGVPIRSYPKKSAWHYNYDPLIKTLQYTTVEGAVLNPSFTFFKSDTTLRNKISFIIDARYGFHNRHINPWAGVVWDQKEKGRSDKKLEQQSFFIAGGKRVSQFFKESDNTGLANSIGTLLYGRNYMKIYENYFAKGGFTKSWESGVQLRLEGEYEDRLPLNNTTDYIWNKKWRSRFTPNYPQQIMSTQFARHQAVLIHTVISFQSGQKYIQFPNYKLALGSTFPKFSLNYTKGINDLLGSDVDYDKWSFKVVDDVNLKLAGSLSYNVSLGGFLNNKKVYAQDYQHYYENLSLIAGAYTKGFQIVSDYTFSNASAFYSEVHLEHHANGLLTNKLALLKKLKWNLVEGFNALYINPDTKYAELFVGLENIFKIFRVDAVVGLRNGFQPAWVTRIGFGGLIGDVLNKERFKRTQKIIDVW